MRVVAKEMGSRRLSNDNEREISALTEDFECSVLMLRQNYVDNI